MGARDTGSVDTALPLATLINTAVQAGKICPAENDISNKATTATITANKTAGKTSQKRKRHGEPLARSGSERRDRAGRRRGCPP